MKRFFQKLAYALALAIALAALLAIRFCPGWWEPVAIWFSMRNPITGASAWLKFAEISPDWPIEPDPGPQIRFKNVAKAAGIQVGHAQGACWGDYDLDGYPDLFVATSGFGSEPNQSTGARFPDRLFHNKKDGTFDDVGIASGFTEATISVACAWGDLDNDGFPDLVVTDGIKNGTLVYMNNKDGTFSRMDDLFNDGGKRQFTKGLALGDVDRDGLLDVYLGYSLDPFSFKAATDMKAVDQGGERGNPNRLFRNLGEYGFEDITAKAGDPTGLERGEDYASVLFDSDLDGDSDLLVTNDYREDILYINDGKGRFSGQTMITGRSKSNWTSCMGIAIGDMNNDLAPDIYCSQTSNHLLYKNLGRNQYKPIPDRSGVGWASHGLWGMGVTFGDFDNDGDLDIFAGNGNVQVFEPQRFLVFQNKGNETFADVTRWAGKALQSPRHSEGVAAADFDQDGRMDVFVSTDDALGKSLLLRNRTKTDGNWLEISLIGLTKNRSAIGARAVLESESGMQTREKIAGSSMYSADGGRLHFGLGRDVKPILTVYWPSGKAEQFIDLKVNQYYQIRENSIPKRIPRFVKKD